MKHLITESDVEENVLDILNNPEFITFAYYQVGNLITTIGSAE